MAVSGKTISSNEDRLLLYCSRLEMNNEMVKEVEKLLQSSLDWDYIWKTTCRHRIASIVFHHVKKTGFDGFAPAKIMKKMEGIYNATAYRNFLIRSELIKVLKVFRDEGIKVLLLKGLALIETIYKNVAFRPMSDIDLLVNKEDIYGVRRCMQELGFSQNLKWEGIQSVDDHHLTFYPLKGQSAPIEVHWNIGMSSDFFPFQDESMVESARVINIGGIETLILSPEDSLVHLCFHLAYHHHCALGLMGLCDISEMINRNKGNLDWGSVVNRAKKYKMGPHVHMALSLVKRIGGTDIPNEVLSRLRRECSRAQIHWLGRFEKNPLIVPSKKWETPLARLVWINGIWNKIRFLFKSLFPSWSAVVFCLPPPLNWRKIFLTYLIHPFLCFKRYRLSTLQHLSVNLKRFLGYSSPHI